MGDLIICGVDGSPLARQAADVGEALARQLGIRAERVEVEGDVAPRLAELADEDGARMIVVGAAGAGVLRTAVLGSVSRQLAEQARCPVVIVPPNSTRDVAAATAVICGLDGSDHAVAAARFAAELAEQSGRRLVLVHARQTVGAALAYPGARSATPSATAQGDIRDEEVEELLGRTRDEIAPTADYVVEPGPPARVLEEVAEREDADLLVVAARGMHLARAALLGSVTRKLTMDAHRPVIVLPEPAEAAVVARLG